MGYSGRQTRGIFEPGQHAGERPGEFGRLVGEDRQAKAGEARRIAIGADRETRALRAKPLDRAGDHRPAGDEDEPFVDAAQAPAKASIEDEAESRIPVGHGPFETP